MGQLIKGPWPNPKKQEAQELFLRSKELVDSNPELIPLYEKILMLDPEHLDTLINLGCLFAEANHSHRAEDLFARALKVDPDSPIAHYNLGVVYHDMRRFEMAAEHYQEALRLDPTLEDARTNLSYITGEL